MLHSIIAFLTIITFSPLVLGSSNYISNGVVETAIQNALNDLNAGVGPKATSCLLCHSSASGGPGRINQSFGQDFQLTAIDYGFGNGSGLGIGQLEQIMADADFLATDSDRDGDDNETEFLNDQDPASDIGTDTNSVSSGGGSGGCGTIGTPPSPPSSSLLILFILPFLVSLYPRRLA